MFMVYQIVLILI